MKRLKLDLSKQGIRRFWLLHAEKVVLFAALLMLGLFVYLGYQTPRYSRKSPAQIVDLARQAGDYIAKDSWSEIQNFRYADSNAHERITDSKVDTNKYQSGDLVGPLVKTLGLRHDPVLRPVEELIARSGTFPVLFRDAPEELRKLPVALVAEDVVQNAKKNEKSETTKKTEKIDPNAPGNAIPELQKQEMAGVREKTLNALPDSAGPAIQNMVSVVGLIPYENQFAEYERVFASSLGYYPNRDRPIYQKIQIQRREEGGNWVDITGDVLLDAEQFSINQDSFVPDIIDPRYYYGQALGGDPVTGVIPPICIYDYRAFVSHPKIPSRQTVPTAVKREMALEEEKFEVNRDPLAREKPKTPAEIAQERAKEEQEEISKIKTPEQYVKFGKRIKPAAPYKLLRFFDMRPPQGKRVQYRVRLWLPDANNPEVLNLLKIAKSGEKDDKDAPQAGAGGLDGGGSDQSQSSSQDQEEDGLEKDWDVTKQKLVMVEPRMLDKTVRERKPLDDPDMPADRESVQLMLPTPWSNETDFVMVGADNFQIYAGKVEKPAVVRVGGVEIPKEEPLMELVAGTLSDMYNTLVPGFKKVGRADVVNFIADKSHVLDPANLIVRVLEKAEIKTNAIVVDIMGGETLPIKGAQKKVDFTAPGEALVMDASGNFHLQNDIRDAKGFRHVMFRDDESNTYGKPRPVDDDKKGKGDEGGSGGGNPGR